MMKISTKQNNTLPTSQSSCSSTEPNFLFLVILGLIFSIHLTVYWRCSEDINRVFVQGLIYLCFFFKFYQKQNQVKFSSSLWSRFTGLVLIFLPLLRSRFLLVIEEGNDFQYLSAIFGFISIIGYIILISGFKGLKQFKQELIFLSVASILIPFVSKVFILIEDGANHNFLTVISAKFTTFFLWYFGFNPTNQGSIIHVNGGSVDVNLGCTGWALFMMLMQLSCCVLILFRSSLKNNLLFPFLLSFFVTFILSIIRLMILALVVKDKIAFQYWHYDEGASLFTSAGMVLFWGIVFLKLPNSLSLDITPVNFRARPNPFLLITSLILGIIFLTCGLLFAPIAGVNQMASYKFPDQIPLAGWQLIDSYSPSLIVKTLVPETNPNQERDSETESLDKVFANQIYYYTNDNNSLIVNAHYIANTSGEIKNYYKKFQKLPQLKNAIEKQGKNGSYLYFIKDKQPSFTACVSYQGKTTVTSSQFGQSFYKLSSNNFQISNLVNWLMGKTVLNDKRCLWLEASMNNQSSDTDTQLMSAWSELVSYWQNNFPLLRN